MAEIRKHDPSAGNAIAQALRAQLGEGVRPRVPGEPARTPSADPEPGAGATTWVNLTFTAPAAAPVSDDEDEDQD